MISYRFFKRRRTIPNWTRGGRHFAGTCLLCHWSIDEEAWRQLVHSGRTRRGYRVPENFLKEREMIMEITEFPDCAEGMQCDKMSVHMNWCDSSFHSHSVCIPGLVHGIEAWDDQQCYYYAMEHCKGELFDFIIAQHDSPRSLCSKQQLVPMESRNEWVESVTSMFRQLCETMQWLHSKGICHLDLSLENSMLSDFEKLKIKIIDFGLCQKFKINSSSICVLRRIPNRNTMRGQQTCIV